MKANRWAMAGLLLVQAGLAGALPMYGGAAGSTNGGGYILRYGSNTPFNDTKSNCGNNACVSTAIKAGADGLGASYVQAGSGNFFSAGNGGAGAWMQGDVTVVPLRPGGPAFIDAVLHLDLHGRTLVEAQGETRASGGVAVSVEGPTRGSQAVMKEYWGANVDVPPNLYAGITRSGSGGLDVALRITPGQPFSLRITLEAFGTATGFGTAAVRSLWGDTLTLASQGPVIDLAGPYSVQSADWTIVDNQWCPSGCLPVPEPATGPLLLLGLAALGGALRGGMTGRRRQSSTSTRPKGASAWAHACGTAHSTGQPGR